METNLIDINSSSPNLTTSIDPELIYSLWVKLERYHDELTNEPKATDARLRVRFNENRVRWAKDKYTFYVLQHNYTIVGYIRVSVDTKTKRGWVSALYVDKEYRGKDYGRLLVEAGIAWLKSNANPKLSFMCTVIAENEAVLEFYKKCGFTKVTPIDEDYGKGFVLEYPREK